MISLIRTVIERGVTFFSAAEADSPFINEEFVGEFLASKLTSGFSLKRRSSQRRNDERHVLDHHV
jgi:aryl-alcohol dehydrogenase-like predicted oxidoreductase